MQHDYVHTVLTNHGLYIKMDGCSPLLPTIQIGVQNILDMNEFTQ